MILMVQQYRSYRLSLEKIQEPIQQQSVENLLQDFRQVIDEKEQKLLGLMKEKFPDLSYVTQHRPVSGNHAARSLFL